LNGNCTPYRIDNTRELGQQAITGGLDDSPLMVRDTWLDQFTEVGRQVGERALFVLAHQSRITRDIGCQDRR
jgi:hypothetical protein